MKFLFVTLFPEQIEEAASHSIIARAKAKGLVEVSCINPRDFTHDNHRTVDDTPFGGGAGMVLKPEPMVAAIRLAKEQLPNARVIAMCPGGRTLKQSIVEEYAHCGQDFIFVCGHYEGFDERIRILSNAKDYELVNFCEFDKYAIKSYNAVHGTNYNPIDIKNVHGEDLNIKDTDKYCYFMTYSFPCTDISNAGKMEAVKDGLKKGSDTRSGLLWEVERLLEECTELPQILFMENVPGVASLEGFTDWRIYLEKKGYSKIVCTNEISRSHTLPEQLLFLI